MAVLAEEEEDGANYKEVKKWGLIYLFDDKFVTKMYIL
jgi:hypothetical protein